MKLIMESWRGYLHEVAIGQCYPFAVKMANGWEDAHIDPTKPPGKGVHPDIDNKDKFKVVHGRITDTTAAEEESFLHGWVEKGDLVFDWQTQSTFPDGIPKEDWYEMYQPEIHGEYTAEEVSLNCLRQGTPGPWTDK